MADPCMGVNGCHLSRLVFKARSVKLPAMFDAVLFDLDGTLINSSADLCAAVNAVRGRYGLASLPVSEVAPHIGGGLGSLLSLSMPEREGIVQAEDRDVFLAYYQEGLLETTWLHEPLADWQRTLRHPTALVTNKPRRFGLPIIAGLGLQFSTAVFGDDGYGRKPAAEPLLTAIGRLEGHAERTLMIGDAPEDLAACRAAGIRFVAVPWCVHRDLDAYRVDSVDDLTTLLKG